MAVVTYSLFEKVQLKGWIEMCLYGSAETLGNVPTATAAAPLARIRYYVLFQWNRNTIFPRKSENHTQLQK